MLSHVNCCDVGCDKVLLWSLLWLNTPIRAYPTPCDCLYVWLCSRAHSGAPTHSHPSSTSLTESFPQTTININNSIPTTTNPFRITLPLRRQYLSLLAKPHTSKNVPIRARGESKLPIPELSASSNFCRLGGGDDRASWDYAAG